MTKEIKPTAGQLGRLKTLAVVVAANGGPSRLSITPTADLVAAGWVYVAREGRSGHAGKGARYDLTAAGRALVAG